MAREQFAELVVDQPEAGVYLAASVEADAETRRRLMRVLGAVALEGRMSPEQEAAEQASLPAVIEDYFSTDPEKAANGRARLRADFRTNTFEILCESGHVSLSRSKHQADGFYQNGYNLRAIFAHGTLHAKHEVEHRRRVAETLTELRIEDGYEAGRFKTHYLIEESRSPDTADMSDAAAKESGYNVRTRKAMLRCTEVDDKGNRVTLSAPVFGVDSLGRRRDDQGVRNIHESLRTGLAGASATEALEGSFWVPKSMLPNGIVDVVRLYDQGVGGTSFFGVEEGEGDYATVIQDSLHHEERAERELDNKVHQLALALRGFERESDCMKALLVMARHAKNFATELCVQDDSFDASQFGTEAAYHLELARHHARLGNAEAQEQALNLAKETAITFMCGMSLDPSKTAEAKAAEEKGKLEDCEFVSKKCPKCGIKNVKTTVRKGVYIGQCGCRSS